MKIKLRLFIVMAVIAFSLVACKGGLQEKPAPTPAPSPTPAPTPTPTPNPAPNPDELKVSFESFNPRSLSVKNNTGKKLIAFKGRIERSSLISGVPAYAGNHGLRMDKDLFANTEDFALLFVTEEDFNANKDDLNKIANSPFASIYAFYNKDGSNNLAYTISSRSGGDLKFTLNNNTPFNAEIRVNSVEGEVLAYVGAYTANTVINVSRGDYLFFPIFKKYMPRDNEIYSIIPKFKKTKAPKHVQYGITDNNQTFNVSDCWDPDKLTLSSGGFYLTVNNQSKTGVSFQKGQDKFITSLGIRSVGSGRQETFFVPFPRNADKSYPDKFEMSTLRIGSELAGQDLPKFEYELDQKYVLDVTGEDADDLQISPVRLAGKVDINGLFGI